MHGTIKFFFPFSVNFEFHEEDEPFEFPGENILSDCHEIEAPKDAAARQPADTIVEQQRNATTKCNITVAIYNQVSPISLKRVHENLERKEAEEVDEMEMDFENTGNFEQIFY